MHTRINWAGYMTKVTGKLMRMEGIGGRIKTGENRNVRKETRTTAIFSAASAWNCTHDHHIDYLVSNHEAEKRPV